MREKRGTKETLQVKVAWWCGHVQGEPKWCRGTEMVVGWCVGAIIICRRRDVEGDMCRWRFEATFKWENKRVTWEM